MYAFRKNEFDALQTKMAEVYESDNEQKLKGLNFPNQVTEIVKSHFDAMITDFIKFYSSLKDIDKSDIDNLLKNKSFDDSYKMALKKLIGVLPEVED